MTQIVMAGPKTPEDKAKATGIDEKYFRPLEQEREKPEITRSYVGGPRKLTFTMNCIGACLREDCVNRYTGLCGDNCRGFSSYEKGEIK